MEQSTYLELLARANTKDRDGLMIPGITEITKVFKGFNRKRLYMYSANSNGGKSLFMEYVAAQALLQHKSVWYHTIEEPSEDILRLILSAYAPNLARDACVDPDDPLIKDFPYGNLTITEGVTQQPEGTISELLIQNHTDLFIFDYLTYGCMDVGFFSKPDMELKQIAQTLHSVARVADCAVLTASQLNRTSRDTETRETGYRNSSQLQGSYSLQDPLDVGIIATTWFDMSTEEQNLVGAYWDQNPILLGSERDYKKKHTLVLDIYKNRSGEKNIKKFMVYDPIYMKIQHLDITTTD